MNMPCQPLKDGSKFEVLEGNCIFHKRLSLFYMLCSDACSVVEFRTETMGEVLAELQYFPNLETRAGAVLKPLKMHFRLEATNFHSIWRNLKYLALTFP